MISHRITAVGGVKYIEYLGIKDTAAYFSTRSGGASKSPYHSLNLALHVGDERAIVLENRNRLGRCLNMPLDLWVTAQQTHGKKVLSVTNAQAGRGCYDYAGAFADVDGLLTVHKTLPLVTFYADCVPIFLADDKKGVVGLVHAGWKGTAQKIAAVAVLKMTQEYSCHVADIKAIIGPSIGPSCYQVDSPVIDAMEQAFAKNETLLKFTDANHALLDLWAANRLALQEAGLTKENIYTTGLCTCCEEDLFYSYRRDGGHTGRMAALIMLQ